MKVVVTLNIPVDSLDDLIGFFKVYRQKDGYREFVYVSKLQPLKELPHKLEVLPNVSYVTAFQEGYNNCIDDILGEQNDN